MYLTTLSCNSESRNIECDANNVLESKKDFKNNISKKHTQMYWIAFEMFVNGVTEL